MSWNYNKSLDRINDHLESLGEIQIEKLVREADLHSLLSETCCREIFGAHVYIDVPNFNALATEVEGEGYRRVVQAVHLYQREVSRIVEGADLFDAVRVHFQGPKLHALLYRPIYDAETIAARAVMLQFVIWDFVRRVFNPEFPSLPNITVAGGAHIGTAIGTQDGMKGDRELLFLGNPANYAAKIIGPAWQMRLTTQLYTNLPESLQGLCEELEDGNYALNVLSGEDVEQLAAEFDIPWKADASRARIQQDKRTYPLKDIEYSEAETLIDLDSLGIKNNKRVSAASLFADVDKFTAYIDEAKTDDEKKTALRVLHAIRKEMAAVVKHDFDGLRIQYQGDRVQALFHLPKDDGAEIVDKTVDAAIALQSSMEQCIKTLLPESASLGLALGIDIDTTLVSKLGIRGDRDRICIGTAVQNAAETQEACHSLEIGTTARAYSLLSNESAEQFTFDEERGIYVALALTVEKMERLKKAAAYRSGSSVFVNSSSAGVAVRTSKVANEREVLPARSYSE